MVCLVAGANGLFKSTNDSLWTGADPWLVCSSEATPSLSSPTYDWSVASVKSRYGADAGFGSFAVVLSGGVTVKEQPWPWEASILLTVWPFVKERSTILLFWSVNSSPGLACRPSPTASGKPCETVDPKLMAFVSKCCSISAFPLISLSVSVFSSVSWLRRPD